MPGMCVYNGNNTDSASVEEHRSFPELCQQVGLLLVKYVLVPPAPSQRVKWDQTG